jgi:hypothetical protein
LPKPGERVSLSDEGGGDLFLAGDLESLQFYHSSPGPEQIGRFRSLAETGKLFVVAKGTTAVVARVVEGQLPEGLKALELRLLGEKGGVAWVSESFVRGLREKLEAP